MGVARRERGAGEPVRPASGQAELPDAGCRSGEWQVYGICVGCLERTPMERLVIAPGLSLCLSCAHRERRSAAA